MLALEKARKKARGGKGMTQAELAKAVGRRQATISRLENGTTRQIDLDLLMDIAEALGVRPLELFAEEPPRRGK